MGGARQRHLAIAAIAALSCGVAASPRAEPAGTTSSAIIGGVASTPMQNFVVQVVHPAAEGVYLCSGSLVAPNLVLTARHCVSVTPDLGFSCDESGDGSDGGTIGPDYDPSTVFIYAGMEAPNEFTQPTATASRFFHDDATNVCNHDLALIQLAQPIDGVPVAPLDVDSELTVGEDLTAVGWGVTAAGSPPNIRQQLAGVPVLAVGPSTDAAGYEVASNEFEVGQSICEGDSGGPALDATNAIVGVVSRGGNGVGDASAADPAATCVGPRTVNVFTETAAFRSVILEAFAAAGATPTLAAVKLGEACTASDECASGLCAPVAGAEACTESCGTTSCPTGFRCDDALCVPAPRSGCSAATEDEPSQASWVLAFALGLTLVRARRHPGASGP